MRLHHILTNFNILLNHRGIKVDFYDQLLKNTDDEDIINNLKTLGEEELSKTAILKTFSDDIESNLTTIVTIDNYKILIYWSLTTGKNFIANEYSMLEKSKDILDIDYIFTMCLYDKHLAKTSVWLEVFNYNDVITNPLEGIYGVSDISLYLYKEWIEENPMLEGIKIPTCYMNDPLARYVGAKPGNIIKIKRKTFLPTMLFSEEITFRMVTGLVNTEMSKTTGLHYRS